MVQKVCTKCKQRKEGTEFRKRSKAYDGLSSWCKECFKTYEKESYATGRINVKRKYTNRKIRTEANKEFIKEYLLNTPCIDCGDTDWWNLEFDHREQEDKSNNVNYLMQHASLNTLKKEIEKCDVRCLKCHRKRTIHQLGWWKIVAFN